MPYHACSRCGFLFSTHLDGPGASALYEDAYFEDCDQGAGQRAGLPLALASQASRWVGRPLGRVLDFGSGTGRGVEAMRAAGLEAEGIDVVPPEVAADWIRVGQLEAEGRYDLITAVEVLEHLPDPHGAVAALARALKPGGLLAFTTALHDPRHLDPRWWYLAPGAGHVSLHTRASLRHLASRHGFRVLLMTPTNHLWSCGGGPTLALRVALGRIRDKLKALAAGRP